MLDDFINNDTDEYCDQGRFHNALNGAGLSSCSFKTTLICIKENTIAVLLFLWFCFARFIYSNLAFLAKTGKTIIGQEISLFPGNLREFSFLLALQHSAAPGRHSCFFASARCDPDLPLLRSGRICRQMAGFESMMALITPNSWLWG